MTVRNEEKKAFRDLTPEERGEIVEAAMQGGVEIFLKSDVWEECKSIDFIWMDNIYRTRPRQLVIPWEVIRPEFKWAAMDCDDVVILHMKKPVAVEHGFASDCERVADMLNINTTAIDWRESLTERPEGV